jgi:hypothetical protein
MNGGAGADVREQVGRLDASAHPLRVQMIRRNNRYILPGDWEYCRGRHPAAAWRGVRAWRFRDFEDATPSPQPAAQDHAMMLRFDIDDTGDYIREP